MKKLFAIVATILMIGCAGLVAKERVFNGKMDTLIYVTDLDEKTVLTDLTDQDWPWIADLEKMQGETMPGFEILTVWHYMLPKVDKDGKCAVEGECYEYDALGMIADLDGDGVGDASRYCEVKPEGLTGNLEVMGRAAGRCLPGSAEGMEKSLMKALAGE